MIMISHWKLGTIWPKKKNRIIDDYNRARISMVLMQPITIKAYKYHSTLANLWNQDTQLCISSISQQRQHLWLYRLHSKMETEQLWTHFFFFFIFPLQFLLTYINKKGSFGSYFVLKWSILIDKVTGMEL